MLVAGSASAATPVDPARDLKDMRAFFQKRFPNVPRTEFANGVYAIDAGARAQWQDIEQFPPYELNVTHGEKLFKMPFQNGTRYADCFPNGGIGIRQNYPYFDSNSGQVKTLELAINECRLKNGAAPLDYTRGDLADLLAYMTYTSRGKLLDIKIPNDAARAAYARGREYFYSKRGQLNLSCADCHLYNAGHHLRAEILSPELGHATHFPVYRSNPEWGELGTLHRRYMGCNAQVRAKPLAPQSETYRDLEYFETYLSNGLPVNGPAVRK